MGRVEPLENYTHRLEKVFEAQDKPKENLKDIKLYIKKEGYKGLSEETQKAYYSAFTVFSLWCTKPLKDLDEIDILDFLDYLQNHKYSTKSATKEYCKTTIHSYKATYKKFFKLMKREDIAELFREKRPPINNDNKKRENLLTKLEVEQLINAANNYRDKALIATLYESGARRGELLSVRIKDLVFDANGVRVTFPKGKTGPRTVRLVYATSFLREWVNNHPCRDEEGEPDKEALVCIALHSKSLVNEKTGEQKQVYECLAMQGLHKQLQKIADRCGIKKKVNPHAWRHARASDLAEHLSDQQLKSVLGWRPDSRMAATYVHDIDTENALLKMNGIEIEDTHTSGLKVGRCPRCKELNPETSTYCGKCGLPLKEEMRATLEKDSADADLLLMEIISKNPDFYKALAEEINKLHNNKNQA